MRPRYSAPWALFVLIFFLGACLHYLPGYPVKLRPNYAPIEPISFIANIPLLSVSEIPSLALVQAIADFDLIPEGFQDSDFSTSICATPTHEEDFLVEWLTFHRLSGIQRFYLFDNEPSEQMRELLKPWINEGSVVLIDVHYSPGTNIAQTWLGVALGYCRTHVLPVSRWTLHNDMDEFLIASAPGWAPSIPTLDNSTCLGWKFPLETMLEELSRKNSRCVPLLRVSVENVGIVEWEGGLVTRKLTSRIRVPPGFKAWGKMIIHSNYTQDRVQFHGPHTCLVPPHGQITNALGEPLPNPYPEAGVPLPHEGLVLNHYGQRSLANCIQKLAVVANSNEDWRTKDGAIGCARNFIPSLSPTPTWREDVEKVIDEAVSQGPQRKRVLEEAWRNKTERMGDLIVDRSAREGWVGRMTKEILDEWDSRGKIGKIVPLGGVEPTLDESRIRSLKGGR